MSEGKGLGPSFEYGREASVVIDDDGVIVAANHFARVGYSLHAIAFAVTMELGAFRRELSATGCARHELHLVDADGAAHEVVVHGVTLEPGRHMVTFEDVGELRKLERTLRQAQRIDSDAYAMLAVARELKELVGEVQLYGAALESRLSVTSEDAAVNLTGDMLAASRRASRLIERMFTALRPSGGAISSVRRRAVRGDETILLLVDDPDLRRALRRTLEEAEYCVLDAASAQAALALAEHHGESIDLLVSDIARGREVVEGARRLHPEVKILEWDPYLAIDPLRAVREALDGDYGAAASS